MISKDSSPSNIPLLVQALGNSYFLTDFQRGGSQIGVDVVNVRDRDAVIFRDHPNAFAGRDHMLIQRIVGDVGGAGLARPHDVLGGSGRSGVLLRSAGGALSGGPGAGVHFGNARFERSELRAVLVDVALQRFRVALDDLEILVDLALGLKLRLVHRLHLGDDLVVSLVQSRDVFGARRSLRKLRETLLRLGDSGRNVPDGALGLAQHASQIRVLAFQGFAARVKILDLVHQSLGVGGRSVKLGPELGDLDLFRRNGVRGRAARKQAYAARTNEESLY